MYYVNLSLLDRCCLLYGNSSVILFMSILFSEIFLKILSLPSYWQIILLVQLLLLTLLQSN